MTKSYSALSNTRLHSAELMSNILHVQQLSHRRLGPFPVERQVLQHAYKLRLPFPMRRLHLVFNVVKLTTAAVDPIPGRHPTPPPPPEIIGGEEEYLVEEILTVKCSVENSSSKSSGKDTDQNMTAGNTQWKFTPPKELRTSTADTRLRQGR